MPTYQYACTSDQCGLRFERVQAFTDPAVSECPDCSERVRKVYGSVGVVFKGSGFYRTDSRDAKAGAKSDSEGAAAKNGDAGKGEAAVKGDAGSAKSADSSGSGSGSGKGSGDSGAKKSESAKPAATVAS